MAASASIAPHTGQAGRWAALGLAVLLLALMWLAVAAPLLDWHRDRAEALAQRAVLAQRMAQIAAGLPVLQRTVQAGAASGPPVGAVLTQPTDAVAAAALSQAVQDMAVRAGSSPSSIETLAPEATGAYRRIRLRIALSAPLPALVGLLQAMDQATPRMLVDDLQLRAAPVLMGRDNPPLDASMTVMAFRAAGPAP